MRLKAALSLFITLIVFALVVVSPTYAATVNFGGTFNVGDPRMSPVVADTLTPYPYACVVDPDPVLYHVYPFYVTDTGSYTFEITAATFNPLNNQDPMIAVYQESFSSSAPGANCLAADNDTGVDALPLLTMNFTTGTQYYLLVQTAEPASTDGTYTGTAKGFGTVIFGTLARSSTSGGFSPAAPDDRINWLFGDDYVVAYPRQDANGDPTLQIYCVNIDSTGTLYEVVTQDDFAAADSSQNTLIAEVQCRIPASVYVLSTGEYQLNIGPNVEGTVLSVIWRGLPPTNIYTDYFDLYQQ